MFLIIRRVNPCAIKGKIIPGDIFKQNAWLWQLIISRVLPSRHNLNFELTTKSIGGGVPVFLRVFKLCKKLWYVCQKKPPINLGFGIKGDSFFFVLRPPRWEGLAVCPLRSGSGAVWRDTRSRKGLIDVQDHSVCHTGVCLGSTSLSTHRRQPSVIHERAATWQPDTERTTW